MGYLTKDTFICLDCEATGLKVESDEIVEIAVVKFSFDTILEEFETLIDPRRPIPAEVIEVHHITNEMVQGKPFIEDVLPNVLSMIGKHTIVGHNIGFDLSLIIESAKRRNIACEINLENTIDTVRLARLYAESTSNTLENLRKHFNIPEEGAHRAMNDVIVNIQVFKYLAHEFKKTEDIIKRLKEPILLKTMPLGKHKGIPFREIPIDYLHWALNQDFDRDLLYTLMEEKRRRKREKSFSESSNPFRDVL